jgi:hypothetical protein
MPYRTTRMANCRYVCLQVTRLIHRPNPLVPLPEHLQDRLNREISVQDEFSNLPFRFAEISKVLLDVCVCFCPSFRLAYYRDHL